MPLTDLSDEQLVARLRSEADPAVQQELAGELYTRHYQTVTRWCLRIAGDRDVAADLAQDIFLKAHRNLGTFRLESKFTTWLYVITRNECFTRLRSKPVEPAPLEIEVPDGGRSPESAAERASQLAAARQIIMESLDETERRVFLLHFAQELPLSAITHALGLENTSGAKAYIVSARRKLAKALPRWLAGAGRVAQREQGHESP